MGMTVIDNAALHDDGGDDDEDSLQNERQN